jgi:hypothetical protein
MTSLYCQMIMADEVVSEVNGSVDARSRGVAGEIRVARRSLWFLGWLILLAVAIGVVSLLSYSLAGSELVRSDAPIFAAWWEARQFLFMEGGATALGLLLGVAVAERLVADQDQRFRAGLVALVLAIIAFAPLIHVCAVAARSGWNGRAASLASWIISREGYDAGRQIDKVVIAGVYFFKTVGFAFLSGLGLMAIACVAVIAWESANPEIG